MTVTQNPADFDRCDECSDFDYLDQDGLCSECRGE